MLRKGIFSISISLFCLTVLTINTSCRRCKDCYLHSGGNPVEQNYPIEHCGEDLRKVERQYADGNGWVCD